MVSPEHEKGILLELKGKGADSSKRFLRCRNVPGDFFRTAREMGRCLNGLILRSTTVLGFLNIPELAEKCRRAECITDFPRF